MATSFVDPGGGNSPIPSYAKSLKTTKFQKLDRNVLDIVLEKKTVQKAVQLKCDEVSRLCEIVGLKVGIETEGYQAHYSRKKITLSVWAKDGVSLERRVMDQPREFNSDLTITQVRPAHRREVTLLITGLPFNTPDSQVKHYVESFGAKMMSVEPIYGVYKEGPWIGQYNGERRYKVDFTSQITPMGTYHLLNDAKVRVSYPGNTRTCGRCHKAPTSCVGGGIARVCGEYYGERVTLFKHMKELWKKINFDPCNEPADDDDNGEDDISELKSIHEESFIGQPSGSVEESEMNSENNDNESSDGSSEEEDENEDEENTNIKENNLVANNATIPGLVLPLTKNQKKKIRRAKRKNATTPPESKDPKVVKISLTPVMPREGSSLVTELIRKYSSSEQSGEEKPEEKEEEDPNVSPSSTSEPTKSEKVTSTQASTVASLSGSVVPTGVI